MEYKHILVALELSEDSKVLIERAGYLASRFNAEVSFIHIDGTHGEIYSELTDLQKSPDEVPVNQSIMKQLKAFADTAPFPIKNFLVGTGDLSDKLHNTITQNGVDLLICGHHHNFWSRIISYSKHLINKSPVDILVVHM